MKNNSRLSRLAIALAATSAGSLPAHAVSVNPDGLGQALIFPYYTVRSSSSGNAFNTYVSVANHTADAKALRVRVREGRAARAVLSFNLYLGANDVWTGAIVPSAGIVPAADGTRLLTADVSCTDPAFTTIEFSSEQYTGAFADGFGDGQDRTREGYIEMIEMASLTGATRAAVTHNAAGVPANCNVIQSPATFPPNVAAPSGGLSGTLTLINVNNGQDFTLNAEALADLATRPYFRVPADPYPDFASAEIDPVSAVLANGQLYRSVWSRPQDAVSAALMRRTWIAEYVLDTATNSTTDVVVTLPTRHYYANGTQFAPPFSAPVAWTPNCLVPRPSGGQRAIGERLGVDYFNRGEAGARLVDCAFDLLCNLEENFPRHCAASGVASVVTRDRLPADTSRTSVVGSETKGLGLVGALTVTTGFLNGWASLGSGTGSLTSLASSTRLDLATGQLVTGAHVYTGLPLVGFGVRTFSNGTLNCGAGQCQGNYGGAFPFKYRRAISPP